MSKTKLTCEYSYHILYKITRDDGHYYIGMHSTDNLDDGYPGSGDLIKNFIRKYGLNTFWIRHTKDIIDILPTREKLKLREIEFVNEDLVNDPLCMNLRVGGHGGKLSQESRKKISESLTGRTISDDTKTKMALAQIGKKKSEEIRKKISENRKNRKTQVRHTDQSKDKIGKANKGKKRTQGAKDKMSLAKKGLYERKCTVDGITIYKSLRELTDALGGGKAGRKSPTFAFIES